MSRVETSQTHPSRSGNRRGARRVAADAVPRGVHGGSSQRRYVTDGTYGDLNTTHVLAARSAGKPSSRIGASPDARITTQR